MCKQSTCPKPVTDGACIVRWLDQRDGPRHGLQTNQVTALLERSRLEDRRQRKRDGDEDRLSPSLRRNIETNNPGLIYAASDEVQVEATRRKNTAGPVPPSWRRVLPCSHREEDPSMASETRSMQLAAMRNLGSQAVFQADSLREECMQYILRDLGRAGLLVEDVCYLPFHLKEDLVRLAPRVAPLDDSGVRALLLSGGEEIDGTSQTFAFSALAQEDWDHTASLETDVPAERSMIDVDLSLSSVSLPMLRQVLLQEEESAVMGAANAPFPRLPHLKHLSLSFSAMPLSQSLVSLLSLVPMTALSIAGLKATLYSPLQSLALALPFLRSLDVSKSDWLQWDHISRLEWSTQWTELRVLDIRQCSNLEPPTSYLDIEGRQGGPSTIMHTMSLVREAGRTRWIDIVA